MHYFLKQTLELTIENWKERTTGDFAKILSRMNHTAAYSRRRHHASPKFLSLSKHLQEKGCQEN
jgi:hypothetical protein